MKTRNESDPDRKRAVNVLVVDDEKKTERLYRLYFRRKNELNLKFSFAKNGKDALRKIEQAEIPFNVIITDIRMPEMDGIELLRQIKSLGREVVTIMMTGYDINDYQKEAAELGVIKLLPKPVNFELLLVVIRQGLSEYDWLNDED